MRRLLLVVCLLVPAGCSRSPQVESAAPGSADRRARMLNLRRVADAVRAYHGAYGRYPMSDRAAGGETAMSWRVQILPFLDDADLDEAGMPRVFALPGHAGAPGQTHYQVLVGPDTMFPPGLPGLTEAEVERKVGTANAIMIVEAAQPVPWGSTRDLAHDDPNLPDFFAGGFCAAFPDGHVEFIPSAANPAALRGMIAIGKQLPIKRNWLPE